MVGQFGDVEETFKTGLELDEDTKVGQLRDLAFDNVVGLVTAGDVGLPGVFAQLLETQRDPLPFLIDVEDLAAHALALFEDLVGMADLAGPAHVGDVQEAVDALLDLDEGPVVRQVPHRPLDHGAGRVLAGDLVPGVGLGLLHPQGDFLLLLVDAKDDDLDLVADLDELAGVVDPLGPRHLGDVDEPFDPLFELDEGAVAHHVDDFAGDAGGDRVLLLDLLPRAGALLLQPERDLLAVLVDVEDHDLDLVVDLDHVAGVVDPSPRHVGDVQEAVDSAEVHERAEVGDVLDRAGADLPGLDLGQKLLLLLLAGDLDQLAARDDDVPPALVDLQDHALDLLIDVVGDVAGTADVHLAGGQEDVDADIDEQAALDLAGDLALDDVALVVLGDHPFPGDDPLRLLARQDDLAGLILHAFEQDLDQVARLGGRLVLPLEERDEPFRLVADVHDHLVADDLDDRARDDLADVEVRAAVGQIPVEVAGVRPLRGHDGRQFVLADVEFTKQVAIYHG